MTGPFRLHALSAGTLAVPRSFAFFGDDQPGHVELGFYVWIVSDGTSIGLVDTGLPLDTADRATLLAQEPFEQVRLLPDLLAAAGLAGDDIDFVAITQTITYHTGGIDAELLPRAQFYLSLAGVRELMTEPPGHPPASQYFTDRGWTALRQLAIEGRLHCVDEPTEVVPGIVFETTGGHHPGSAALRIGTASGSVGLLETAFVADNLARLQPIGICEDVATCRAVMRRYLHDCDQVVAIHDPANAGEFPLEGFAPPTRQRPRAQEVS